MNTIPPKSRPCCFNCSNEIYYDRAHRLVRDIHKRCTQNRPEYDEDYSDIICCPLFHRRSIQNLLKPGQTLVS